MKQTAIKILLLLLAAGIICAAIAFMVNTATNTPPAEPDINSALALKADSLTERFTARGNSADFARALDFSNLCLRERQIDAQRFNANIRNLVADSAGRAYGVFRTRVLDTDRTWNHSELQSAINAMTALQSLKLADGNTAAMNTADIARLDSLRSYENLYSQCYGKCTKGFNGNVSYENARTIINDAENFLRNQPLMSRNAQIAEKKSNMRARLTAAHAYHIKGKIDDIPQRDFSNEDELNNYIRSVNTLRDNYSQGINNGVYDRNSLNVEYLRSELENNYGAKLREIQYVQPAMY